MITIPEVNVARAARAIEMFGGTICEAGFIAALPATAAGPLVTLDVALAITFIESCAVERTSLHGGDHSYALKHRAEEWLAHLGQNFYLGNGCLIAGALATGVPVKATGLNAKIGLRALIPARAWFTHQQQNNSRSFT